MIANPRDRQIVLLVNQFHQLTSGHVRDLVFHDTTGMPPFRALKRLVESRHLVRIEKKMAGGSSGGSGQYVYQLGSEGWKLARREGRYYPQSAVNYHTLAIADVHVQLKKLERTGEIKIIGFMNEFDSAVIIGGAKLTPDYQVEIGIPAKRQSLSLWIEIDLGTERPKQIKDKLMRYWHAYQNATEHDLATFPVVLFLAPDEERVKELRWVISRGDEETRALFMVGLMSDFPEIDVLTTT
ncbi:replication-relaxation family protein [Subtercola sp. RTI3]|uniref:replication-relaxation family protein n=1 Tax=Subtercola sp. RTI3 TaxID=3048639 RepID=UPI002B22EEBD|nr:replication-relaxation family protein [Subtercola sp. RTI3]MEA9985666.1 replication-relaxation family protein [Subtercola sp. RTI3]